MTPKQALEHANCLYELSRKLKALVKESKIQHRPMSKVSFLPLGNNPQPVLPLRYTIHELASDLKHCSMDIERQIMLDT